MRGSMKTPPFFSVVFVALFLTDPSNALAQGSRYTIVPGAFTWQEAKADVEARGGHLAN